MTQPAPRWDPFREIDDLYARMGRLWQSVFEPGASPGSAWSPLADVRETEDAYIVEVDVPGVRRDDIDIDLRGDELSIAGELKETEREGLFRKRTRRTGHFEYRTSLPRDVDPDNISASLADGVLTVRIPKADAVKPRRIEITGQ